MATRRGPIQDDTGTYYEVTGDDGRLRREYVNTDPNSSSTTISAQGDIVQPSADAMVVGPSQASSTAGGTEETSSRRADGGTARETDSAGPRAPSASTGRGAGGFSTPAPATYGSPSLPAPKTPKPAAIPATELGAELSGLGPRIAGAAGASPRAPGYERPSISSDAGWAGPHSVGVFQGARVDNGQPQASQTHYPSGHPLMQRAFDEHGRSYADRGSHRSPLYDKVRAKGDAMAGKVRGMASKFTGGGGGYSSGGGGGYSSGHYKTPHQPSQKRIDKAFDKFNLEIAHPDPLKVHGILKQMGVSPYGAMAYLSNPEWILTRPGGLLGHPLVQSTVQADQLQREPITDIAMLMGGTQTKNALTKKTPAIKPPHILKKLGVKKSKPIDPLAKRQLDPSAVADEIASVYQGILGSHRLPTNETLLSNLGSVKKKSALGQELTRQYRDDPGAAVDSVRRYLHSAILAGKPRDAFYDIAERGIDTNFANTGWQLADSNLKKFTQAVGRTVGSFEDGTTPGYSSGPPELERRSHSKRASERKGRRRSGPRL